jgi:serine/threonine protein phosphatase 1
MVSSAHLPHSSANGMALADRGGHGQRHVVHGHHQHADGPKLYQHRSNLDCGAFYTGRLVVGVFDDDKPGVPVDFIEVTGE